MKTVLFLLMLCMCVNADKLLIVGNSRAAASNFRDSLIASQLGCDSYINVAVPGYTVGEILTTVSPGIAQAGDSLRAIVFMDLSNNTNGYIGYTPTYYQLDSICKLCIAAVGVDSFYFVQNCPSNSAYALNDSAVITTINPRGSRAKTGYFNNLEYDLAVKHGFKFATLQEYFSHASIDSADYSDGAFYTDGVHYNDIGQDSIASAIVSAKVKTSKTIPWGASKEGTWKCWYRKGSAAIIGDTATGQINIPNGDSVLSPIKCIGWNTKTVVVTPHLASGSVNIFVRYNDTYFKRNDTIAWLPYSGNNVTDKNFCQFMMVASANAVVDSVYFAWSNRIVNNRAVYKQFGNRIGMVREWHKDTHLAKGQGRSYGGQHLVSHDYNGMVLGLTRWGFDYDIPQNARIDSAKLHYFVAQQTAPEIRLKICPVVTAFGASRTWDEYEQNQTDTPTVNQATWRYAKSNTVRWQTPGDTFGISDYDPMYDSIVKPANAIVGTEIISNVKNIVSRSAADTSRYYGWVTKGLYTSSTDNYVNLYSQNSASDRPYLEVWYTTLTRPVFTLHPVDDTVASGGTLSFSANATGNGAVTYKWFRGSDSIGTGSSISFKANFSDYGKLITCVATDDSGSTTSNAATIYVSMSTPSTYYIDITVNKDSVQEVSTSFLHKIDLSPFINSIDTHIDSSNDVIVISRNGNTIVPRSSFYTPGEKLLIDFLGVKDTLNSNVYRICLDTGLSSLRPDTIYNTAYSGIRGYWGFNNNVRDYYGKRNGTLNSPGAITDSGLVLNGASGSVAVAAGIIDTGDITIDCDIKLAGYGESGTGRVIDNGVHSIWINSYSVSASMNGHATAVVCSTIVSLDVWHHLTVSRSRAGSVTVYVDGVKIATKSAGTPSYVGTTAYIGNRQADDRTFNGIIKNFAVYNSLKTDAFALDRYKSIYQQGTFYTIKDYVLRKSTGNRIFFFGNIVQK